MIQRGAASPIATRASCPPEVTSLTTTAAYANAMNRTCMTAWPALKKKSA